jgi:hypothetical protein
VTDLNNGGLASITPTIPASAPVIPKDRTDYTVTLPLNVNQNFPQSCADTVITVTFDFEGTSAV